MKRIDVIIAVALAVLVQVELVLTHGEWLPFATLGALSVALSRTHPVLPVIVIAATTAIDFALTDTPLDERNAVFLSLAVACALAGRWAVRTRDAIAAPAFAVVALTAANQLMDQHYSVLDDVVWATLMLGTPTVIARVLRDRAMTIAALEERSAELRAAQAEVQVAAVVEERARLAIGVHDALAHRLGDIALQAAGAEQVSSVKPDAAVQALARIEDSARGALADIREVVGVLRRDDELIRGTPQMHAMPSAPREQTISPSEVDEPREVHPRLDAAIAAAVFVAIAVESSTSSRLEGAVIANVAGAAVIAVPLLWRTRAPLISAVALFAAVIAFDLLLTPITYLVTPIAVSLLPAYSVGAYLPRRQALAGLAACLLAQLAFEPSVIALVLMAAVFAAARAVRQRNHRARELERVTAELEVAHAAVDARARSEERLRVSRELHDAVAHRMTVIVLQAGAAQRVWGDHPDAARHALHALADVARETLTELRVALENEGPVASIEELVARVRPLGVDVEVSGSADALDPVAFSVVREALTNAVRHAAPTQVRIELRPDRVVVTDTGRNGTAPPAVPGTGTGLRGLAERVAERGGKLAYGPDGPGFRVEALL